MLMQQQLLIDVGGWDGFRYQESWEEMRNGQRFRIIRLEPKVRHRRYCSARGRRANAIHDRTERRIRDLPVFDTPVELIGSRVRLAYRRCGPKLEALDWLAPYARVTKRLAASVARLCKVMSLRHVAEFYRLSWTAVKRIDLRHLEQELGQPDLSGANQALMTVHVLKDDLNALWDYRHLGYAKRFWQDWYERAMSSGIAPLSQFARRLKPYLPGILAHTRWPLGTNLVEGINNRIKVIKRMAYGFRDDYYFFLKIRAAFPGNR